MSNTAAIQVLNGLLNPMTTLGDIIYENATPTAARLAGWTTADMGVLTQTGNGTISAAPVWTDTLTLSNVSSNVSFNITPVIPPSAGSVALILAAGNLGIGVYYYGVAYQTALGITSYYQIGSITTDGTHQQVTVTIPTSTDMRVTGRVIYRTKVGGNNYNTYTLTTVADNITTSYTDNTLDSSLVTVAGYWQPNTTTSYITVNGTKALTIDNKATYVGINAGASVGIGGGINTYIGYNSGTQATSAQNNTFVGSSSGNAVTTGGSNTLVGMQAGYALVSGTGNAGFGVNALNNFNSSSSNNTGIGYYALGGTSGATANYNTAIGLFAGYLTTGSNNIYLGAYCGRYQTSQTNVLLIDNLDRTNQANGIANALIYGVTNATATSNTLQLGGTGVVTVNGTQASTTSATGALVVSGGLGIAGAMFITGAINLSGGLLSGLVIPTGVPTTTTATLYNSGGTLYFNGSAVGGSISLTNTQVGYGNGSTIVSSANFTYTAGTTSTGYLTIANTTVSTTSGTGALVVTGGAGIGGAINAGSSIAAAGAVMTSGSSGSVAGSMYYSATNGLVLWGKTGSSTDLELLGNSGSVVMSVATGTVNATFGGNTSTPMITLTGTPSGAISGSIWYNATNGIELWAKTGSSYDFMVATAAGGIGWCMPTATSNFQCAGGGLFSGLSTFSAGLKLSGSVVAAAATIGLTSTAGLVIWANTGSTYDLGLLNPGNSAYYMRVPTTTNIPEFPQGLNVPGVGGLAIGQSISGAILQSATLGTALWAKAGSTNDFTLVNPGNTAYYMSVTTGSNIPVFPQGLTSNGNITLSGAGAGGAGSIYYNSVAGLSVCAKAGSSYDFSLINAANSAYALYMPTGTNNLVMPGTTTHTGLATFNGGISATTGVYSSTIQSTGLTLTNGTTEVDLFFKNGSTNCYLYNNGTNFGLWDSQNGRNVLYYGIAGNTLNFISPTIYTGVAQFNNEITQTVSFTNPSATTFGQNISVTAVNPSAGSNIGQQILTYYTNPVNSNYGSIIENTLTTTATNAQQTIGLYSAAISATGYNLSSATALLGIEGVANSNPLTTITVTGAVGIYASAQHGGAGTTTNLTSIQAVTNKSAGTVTNAYGITVSAMSSVGSTTQAGLLINNISGATTNYAISTGSGIVNLGDTTASTTSATGSLIVAGGIGIAGSINIGTGSASSSYLNIGGYNSTTAYPSINVNNPSAYNIGIGADDTSTMSLRIGSCASVGNWGTSSATMKVHLNSTTPSTTASTGALVVDGGVGIGGAVFITGAINLSGGLLSGLVIPTGVPTTTTATLYNNGGVLSWNGSAVGGSVSLTNTQVGYGTGSGITSSANLTFSGTVLTTTNLTVTGLAYTSTVTSLSGTSVTINAATSNNYTISPAASTTVTFNNPTSPATGQVINIFIVNPSGTAPLLAFGTAWQFPPNINKALSGVSGQRDIISAIYDGTYWIANISSGVTTGITYAQYNQTMYLGTTAVPINNTSGSLSLAGIILTGSPQIGGVTISSGGTANLTMANLSSINLVTNSSIATSGANAITFSTTATSTVAMPASTSATLLYYTSAPAAQYNLAYAGAVSGLTSYLANTAYSVLVSASTGAPQWTTPTIGVLAQTTTTTVPSMLGGAYGVLVSSSSSVPSWTAPVANSVPYQATASTAVVMSASPTLGSLTLNAGTLSAIASTAAISSITMPIGSASYTGTNVGSLWNDLTHQSLATYTGASNANGIVSMLPGVLATIKTTATVTMTTATTYYSVLPTADLSPGAITLPANWWVVGKTVRITLYASMSATGNGTLGIRPVLQGTTVLTATSATLASGSIYQIKIEVLLTCQATGAAGTAKWNCSVSSYIDVASTAPVGPAVTTGQLAATVATTSSSTLDLQCTMSVGASNPFVIWTGVIEALN